MKQEIEIIESWEQVTLAQFEEICKIQEQHPDDDTKRIIEFLYGVDDAEQLPLPEYMAMVAGLRNFAANPVETSKLTPAATYTVEGRQYDVDITPNNFTAGQYIDLTNNIKASAAVSDILTAVVIPHGHTYNDGYDMAAVKRDLLTLPVTVAFAIVGFFVRWSAASSDTFLRCLTKWMKKAGKKGKVSKEQIAELEKATKELRRRMAYYPMYLHTAS